MRIFGAVLTQMSMLITNKTTGKFRSPCITKRKTFTIQDRVDDGKHKFELSHQTPLSRIMLCIKDDLTHIFWA